MTTDKTTNDDLIRDDLIRVKQETIAREFARMEAEKARRKTNARDDAWDKYDDLEAWDEYEDLERPATPSEIQDYRREIDAKMRQVGGDHYKNLTPSPAATIEDWGLGFMLGNVVKYVVRIDRKGHWLEQVNKAIHYLELYRERRVAQVEQVLGRSAWLRAFDRLRGKGWLIEDGICRERPERTASYHYSPGVRYLYWPEGMCVLVTLDEKESLLISDAASSPEKTADDWRRLAGEMCMEFGLPFIREDGTVGAFVDKPRDIT
jgi:hypothetical protein